MTKPYVRLDKDNAAVLLVDHQAGLLSLVRDIDPDKFKNNVLALGEWKHLSGADVLAAFIAGFEVETRIGRRIGRRMTERGWQYCKRPAC